MHPRTSRSMRCQPFKWSRPVTTRDSETSKADQHLITQHHFSSSGNDDESLLDLFLDVGTKSPKLGYERPEFERFFGHGLLERIRDDDFEEPSQPTAWLYDVNQNNEPRAYSGLLTAKQLHHYTTLKAGAEFVLEFHMPCLVWQDGQVLREDMRVTMDGKPIRQGESLSFLSASRDGNIPPEATEILYECQTSFCVTGWDISAWTAICLVDSYFDDESDEDDPRMLPYYPKSDEPDSPEPDALCLGKCLADRIMLKDPREYFLLGCKFHIERISQEWEKIGFKLQQKMKTYRTTLRTADGDSANVEGSEAWFKQTSRLITDLISMLQKTVKCLFQFVERDSHRIDNDADEITSAALKSSFSDILIFGYELEKVLDKLEHLRQKVETFQNQLQFVSPMALAGSTMQAGLVAGNVVFCFFALTCLFGLLTWKMQTVTQWFDFVVKKICQKLPIAAEGAVPALEPTAASVTTGSSFPLSTGAVRRRDRPNRREMDMEQVVGC
ncbi:hypothetical protein CPLU01_11117 [Colletotrichum plurivorum]|uniref:Uncharacterized protein n=1 Tax=Colletotrichum plurivorum TaxID=2175906 RepID=A0A8H6K3V2_9PEZI|nr:hypothetical protein CPLU01_11117 [Colletotrichum plurivorum]